MIKSPEIRFSGFFNPTSGSNSPILRVEIEKLYPINPSWACPELVDFCIMMKRKYIYPLIILLVAAILLIVDQCTA